MRSFHLAACAAWAMVACATTTAPSDSESIIVNEYAFVFRASPSLSPEQLSARNAAAREWALARRDEGVLRTAAPLEREGAVVSSRGVLPSDPALAAVLLITASDLDAALALAREHPGLAYGTTIEVRPVRAVSPR